MPEGDSPPCPRCDSGVVAPIVYASDGPEARLQHTGPVATRGIEREPGWSPDWRCRDCWYMWIDGDPLAGKVERELDDWLRDLYDD